MRLVLTLLALTLFAADADASVRRTRTVERHGLRARRAAVVAVAVPTSVTSSTVTKTTRVTNLAPAAKVTTIAETGGPFILGTSPLTLPLKPVAPAPALVVPVK